MPPLPLPNSLRESFLIACASAKKHVAYEAWPDRSEDYRRVELARALAGERRPPWSLLEAAVQADPFPVVSYLCHRYGFEPPKPRDERVDALTRDLDALRAELAAIKRNQTM